jgi:predicted lipid carrier protein YhbT
MTSDHRAVAPLSPILLAGLALRPIPLALLQPALSIAMATMRRRYFSAFERLAEFGDPLFLIDPVDLPFAFLLRPDPTSPSLEVVRDARDVEPTASIRGPLLVLIDLLEGRLDGDALFFSRELVIEGDTEAVVALRNAVDGAGVDVVSDLLSLLGPFSRPARRLARASIAHLARASRDLNTVQAALTAPLLRRLEAQATMLRDLEERLAALERQARVAKAGRP